jgi:hypothetical protein
MIGEYAALAKWGLIIGAFATVVYFIDDNGYQRASKKYEYALTKQKEKTMTILEEEKTKAAVESAKSNAYATFISEEYNAKVDEIRSASVNFKSNSVREKSLCRRSSQSAVPNNNDPVIHAETAAAIEAGFSGEFLSFIESQIRRDKLQKEWIESSLKVTNELCKQTNVICDSK